MTCSLVLYFGEQLLEHVDIVGEPFFLGLKVVHLVESEVKPEKLKLFQVPFDDGCALNPPLLFFNVWFIDGNEGNVRIVGLNQNLGEIDHFALELLRARLFEMAVDIPVFLRSICL